MVHWPLVVQLRIQVGCFGVCPLQVEKWRSEPPGQVRMLSACYRSYDHVLILQFACQLLLQYWQHLSTKRTFLCAACTVLRADLIGETANTAAAAGSVTVPGLDLVLQGQPQLPVVLLAALTQGLHLRQQQHLSSSDRLVSPRWAGCTAARCQASWSLAAS